MQSMEITHLYELIERLGNLLRAEERRVATDHGLQPVHLHVLHYLTHCNRFSDTPAAVTKYLGLTKGTVSQSLKVLERKALVMKCPDPNDGRKVHLKVTAEGLEVVQSAIPTNLLQQAAENTGTDVAQLSCMLGGLLRGVQRANGSRSFGVCRSCHHFLIDGPSFQCGLTHEPLSQADSRRICCEHTSAPSEGSIDVQSPALSPMI